MCARNLRAPDFRALGFPNPRTSKPAEADRLRKLRSFQVGWGTAIAAVAQAIQACGLARD